MICDSFRRIYSIALLVLLMILKLTHWLCAGINNGANTVLCPTYLAEIAPKSIRGGIGALFQLSVISGVVISFVLGLESLLGNADNWPYLFSVVIVFGLIQVRNTTFSTCSDQDCDLNMCFSLLHYCNQFFFSRLILFFGFLFQ